MEKGGGYSWANYVESRHYDLSFGEVNILSDYHLQLIIIALIFFYIIIVYIIDRRVASNTGQKRALYARNDA